MPRMPVAALCVIHYERWGWLAAIAALLSGCASSQSGGRPVVPGERFTRSTYGVSFPAPPGEWTVMEQSDASHWLTRFGRIVPPAAGGAGAPESIIITVAVERVDEQWIDRTFSSRAGALESRIVQWVEHSDARYKVARSSKEFGTVEGAERLVLHQVIEDRAHPSYPGQVLVQQTDVCAGFSPRDRGVDYVVAVSRRDVMGRSGSVDVGALSAQFLSGVQFAAPAGK